MDTDDLDESEKPVFTKLQRKWNQGLSEREAVAHEPSPA